MRQPVCEIARKNRCRMCQAPSSRRPSRRPTAARCTADHGSSAGVAGIGRVAARQPGQRRGIAAVEFAILLPVIMFLLLSTMEFCQILYLKEKSLLAAQEGARAAIKKNTTLAEARASVIDYLTLRRVDLSGMTDDHIQITPDPETAGALTPITVTVRVPIEGNAVMPGSAHSLFSGSDDISGTVVMYKEYSKH